MNKGLMIGIVLIVVIGLIGGGVWMASRNSQTTMSPVQTSQTMNEEITTSNDATGEMMVEDTSAAAATGKIVELEVVGSSLKFVPNKIEVAKGDTVRIIFKNSADKTHDFVIDEFKVATSELSEGEEEEIEFVADKVGSFEFYCSVSDHRAMGMTGTLVVK